MGCYFSYKCMIVLVQHNGLQQPMHGGRRVESSVHEPTEELSSGGSEGSSERTYVFESASDLVSN